MSERGIDKDELLDQLLGIPGDTPVVSSQGVPIRAVVHDTSSQPPRVIISTTDASPSERSELLQRTLCEYLSRKEELDDMDEDCDGYARLSEEVYVLQERLRVLLARG